MLARSTLTNRDPNVLALAKVDTLRGSNNALNCEPALFLLPRTSLTTVLLLHNREQPLSSRTRQTQYVSLNSLGCVFIREIRQNAATLYFSVT